MLHPFPITVREKAEGTNLSRVYSKALYLSPRLERAAWDIVVAVVAHELAHVAMGHRVFVSHDDDKAQEEAVFNCLCQWGFEREAKKHRALLKWRESWKRAVIRKLKGEG